MTKKAIVRKGRNADTITSIVSQHNGEVLADYGRSLLVAVEQEGLNELASKRYRVRELPDSQPVELNGFRFDPTDVRFQSDEVDSAARSLSSGRSHHLVRFAGPLHNDWKTQLSEIGVEIIEQALADEYLISIDSGQVGNLRELPFVETVSPYYPALKISESLLTPQLQESISSVTGLEPVVLENPIAADSRAIEETLPTPDADLGLPKAVHEPVVGNIELALFDAADGDEAAQGAAAIGAMVIEQTGKRLIVAIPLDSVPQLAALPQVKMVNPYRPIELHNNIATNIMGADVLQNGTGLDGSGQVVAVADTGLDTGDANTMLADFAGRVVAMQALGRPGDSSDPHGHGTHVAGSVLGDGANSNGSVRGLAPAASLVFQSIMDARGRLGGLPNDLSVGLFDLARDEGAHIHTNSWGAPLNGAYNTNSAEADTFAFENRDFMILFSAGNDAPNRVGAPGTAKNVLTVGASENRRALPDAVTFPNGRTINFEIEADDPADIASFSSRGPAVNNRIKPDVVAPGSWILSTRSSRTNGVGRGVPGQPIFGLGNQDTPPMPPGAGANSADKYMYQNGTSMATPLAAGACALLRQYLVEQRGHAPSAALIKALIVNGTVDLEQPVNQQGWGRVDLDNALFPLTSGRVQFDDTLDNALGPADFRIYDVHVASSAEPLTATLVWRDPPAPTIQNHLFLRVIHLSSGAEFTAERDIMTVQNNVQKVVIPAPAPGIYRIEVESSDITPGIPEFPDELRQDYALVVSNGSGFSCNPSDVVQVIDRSGSMGFYGYMEPAKQRAAELVDILQINDQVGIVSFAADAATVTPLTRINSQDDKEDVQADIATINAGGTTDLREALADGVAALGSDTGRPRALILLSDGKHTVGTAAIDDAFLDSIAADNIKVYAIALGAASDFAVLNNIAVRTGTGAAYTVASAADLHKLHEVYYDILGSLNCGNVVHLKSAEFASSQTVTLDSTCLEASFMFSWGTEAQAVKTTLIDPDGIQFLGGDDPRIGHLADETYHLYRVTKPSAGQWQMIAETDSQSTSNHLTTAVIAESVVNCQIEHKADDEGNVQIQVSGEFEKKPVRNLQIMANVIYPTRSIAQLLEKYDADLQRIVVNRDLLNGAADEPALAKLNLFAAQMGAQGKDIFERKTAEVPFRQRDNTFHSELSLQTLGARGNAKIVISAEAQGSFGTHICQKIIPVYVPQPDDKRSDLTFRLIVRRSRIWRHHILGARVHLADGDIARPADGVSVKMVAKQQGQVIESGALPFYRRGKYFIWRVSKRDLVRGQVELTIELLQDGVVVEREAKMVTIR